MKLKHISTTLSALGLGILSPMIMAGNITAISTGTLPHNEKIIKIKFDSDVTLPSGFTTDAPAQIALDFAGTALKMNTDVLNYNDLLLKQISAAEGNGRTRLVVALNKPGQYDAEIKGSEVWIRVSESKAAATVALPPPPPPVTAIRETVTATAPTPQAAAASPRMPVTVDFHKGRGGSGVVVLDLGSFKTAPKINRTNGSLTFTYKNMQIPAEMQRSLDVSDFSTPIRNIRLKRMNNDTELNLSLQGNWDYTQRVENGRQIIEVSQNTDVSSQGLQNSNKKFTGKRISLDFQDVDVRTILQILAKESGMNIVASDSVQGKMTLSLKDVPWDQALDLVMDARNLDMRKKGNIINIAPRDELLARDKSTLTAQNEVDNLGPLITQTFQLKFRNVEDFRKLLRINEDGTTADNDKNSILSPRGSALFDPATNILIITDVPSVIKRFDHLINLSDVAAQQVMVEARIVETTDSFSRQIGVRFGYNSNRGNTSVGSTLANIGNSFSTPNINLPVSAATSSIAIVRSTLSDALGLELSASQADGTTKIISSPRILTQNRREATIESGYEVPYQESTSSGASSTSYKDAVLGLTVTPNITPDGNIIMNVAIKNDTPVACSSISNVSSSDDNGLCLKTKNVKTQAMVENGGTLIVGGIYNEDNENSSKKVPLLGDIPVVGNLFKYRSRSQSRSELLVFITPRIMDSDGNRLSY